MTIMVHWAPFGSTRGGTAALTVLRDIDVDLDCVGLLPPAKTPARERMPLPHCMYSRSNVNYLNHSHQLPTHSHGGIHSHDGTPEVFFALAVSHSRIGARRVVEKDTGANRTLTPIAGGNTNFMREAEYL